MKKSRIIEQLEGYIDEIESLKSSSYDSRDFKTWSRRVEMLIKNWFPNNSNYLADFKAISYYPNVIFVGITDQYFDEAFKEGLMDAEALLESFIEEIDLYWKESNQDVYENERSLNKSEKEFLRLDLDMTPISNLGLTKEMECVVVDRLEEIKKGIEENMPLSVIFMIGSVLEGILLDVANKNIQSFNQSKSSPKSFGNVKHLSDWTLANLIDVCFDLEVLDKDVKEHSHSLRSFRNYIHPNEQIKSSFHPNLNTASIAWQVLKAALDQVSRYLSNKT